MAKPRVEPPSLTLDRTEWRLVHFQSADIAIGTVVSPRRDQYTARFMPDGSLKMTLDCNRLRAKWSSDKVCPTRGKLETSPGMMAQVACGPGTLDTRVARDVARVRSFTISNDVLSFALEADGSIYLWAPVAQ